MTQQAAIIAVAGAALCIIITFAVAAALWYFIPTDDPDLNQDND